MDNLKIKGNKILRHTLTNRIVHWLTAFSIIMLIITGLGQMPLYSRYILFDSPFTDWLKSYEITLWLHYIFAIMLLFVLFYHLVYHLVRKEFELLPKRGDLKQSWLVIKAMLLKREEPPCDKYLPEQRLTYLYFLISLSIIVITGLLKVFKNVAGINPSNPFFFWTAQLHNLGTVLVIIGVALHLGAFTIKINRKLLPGMFTGYVDLDYAKHRHPYWCDLNYINKHKNKAEH